MIWRDGFSDFGASSPFYPFLASVVRSCLCVDLFIPYSCLSVPLLFVLSVSFCPICLQSIQFAPLSFRFPHISHRTTTRNIHQCISPTDSFQVDLNCVRRGSQFFVLNPCSVVDIYTYLAFAFSCPYLKLSAYLCCRCIHRFVSVP